MDSNAGPSEELEEVEEELQAKNDEALEEGEDNKKSFSSKNLKVFTQAFTMTFLAEWGDRSQIATIALAAAKDPYGVTAGGIVGHAMCTGLAVVGGRMLAAKISEKTVTYVGGALFLLFGLHSFVSSE
jgi:putative Ca2+/H+ antiporter (TMEM165/GDT1 family)